MGVSVSSTISFSSQVKLGMTSFKERTRFFYYITLMNSRAAFREEGAGNHPC